MKKPFSVILAAAAAACAGIVLAAQSPAPSAPQTAVPSGQAAIEQSVAAHGGAKLTAWKTVTVTGTVRMRDGISYNAAFTLRAAKPGRIRVDQDQTADGGRQFFEYFLHDGAAWMRRNLVVAAYDAARMKRWLDHADGIAAYAGLAAHSAVKEETDVVWPAPPADAPAAPLPAPRRALRIAITPAEGSPVELLIDAQSHYLIGEVFGATTRLYGDFKAFAGVTWPTRVLELVKGRQGDTQTPFVYTNVAYNTPLEDWIFTEDKPAASKR